LLPLNFQALQSGAEFARKSREGIPINLN
jgi:hypothetical protein